MKQTKVKGRSNRSENITSPQPQTAPAPVRSFSDDPRFRYVTVQCEIYGVVQRKGFINLDDLRVETRRLLNGRLSAREFDSALLKLKKHKCVDLDEDGTVSFTQEVIDARNADILNNFVFDSFHVHSLPDVQQQFCYALLDLLCFTSPHSPASLKPDRARQFECVKLVTSGLNRLQLPAETVPFIRRALTKATT
jgi:hypothetical protein